MDPISTFKLLPLQLWRLVNSTLFLPYALQRREAIFFCNTVTEASIATNIGYIRTLDDIVYLNKFDKLVNANQTLMIQRLDSNPSLPFDSWNKKNSKSVWHMNGSPQEHWILLHFLWGQNNSECHSHLLHHTNFNSQIQRELHPRPTNSLISLEEANVKGKRWDIQRKGQSGTGKWELSILAKTLELNRDSPDSNLM